MERDMGAAPCKHENLSGPQQYLYWRGALLQEQRRNLSDLLSQVSTRVPPLSVLSPCFHSI